MPPTSKFHEVGAQQLRTVLTKLGAALQLPTMLCVIGSTRGILEGQDDRVTIDLDTLRSRSHFDRADLVHACNEVGIGLQNMAEDPDAFFIQIISSRNDRVAVPAFKEADHLGTWGNLRLESAPVSALVASKLCRCSPEDLQDIQFYVSKGDVDPAKVRESVETLPPAFRELARENLVYLDVLAQQQLPEQTPTQQAELAAI